MGIDVALYGHGPLHNYKLPSLLVELNYRERVHPLEWPDNVSHRKRSLKGKAIVRHIRSLETCDCGGEQRKETAGCQRINGIASHITAVATQHAFHEAPQNAASTSLSTQPVSNTTQRNAQVLVALDPPSDGVAPSQRDLLRLAVAARAPSIARHRRVVASLRHVEVVRRGF